MTDEHILNITDQALAKIIEIRAEEPDADELALAIRISGVSGTDFAYDMAMIQTSEIGPGDQVEQHGELPVFIPADSVDNLRGATLDLSRDLLNPGLTIENPNSPSPKIAAPAGPGEVTGPVADQVTQVLNQYINPAIATHGGYVELVAVEEGTAYLRMGGGCQGCGMASVTLTQGIEGALVDAVPEITAVMDVTDHAAGTNPYYEAAKK